jgi:hypothetical protein
MNARQADELVVDYLRRLDAASALLPADRRAELVDEIRAHIEAALAEAGSRDETAVRNVLERLGDPTAIAAEAGLEPAPAPAPAAVGPVPVMTAAARSGPRPRDVVTVLLVLLGGVVGLFLVFGMWSAIAVWSVGLVLLWSSPRWAVREKLLGSLIWPGGLLAPLFVLFLLPARVCTATGSAENGSSVTTTELCTGPELPFWLQVAILVIGVAGPVAVAFHLLRRAGRGRSLSRSGAADGDGVPAAG